MFAEFGEGRRFAPPPEYAPGCAAVIDEACVSVCCDTLLSSELVGSADKCVMNSK